MALETIPNPFHHDIVRDAWQPSEIDVCAIHRKQFEDCKNLISSVLENHETESLVVFGAAVSGKTHLLRRLRGAVLSQASETNKDLVFIFVQLQTSPRMIWRTLRRRFVEDLLRATDGVSQLEKMLTIRFAQELGATASPSDWWHQLVAEHPHVDDLETAVNALFEELGDNVTRDLRVVLTHLLLGRQRADARSWLRGEALPESVLGKLGLPAGEESDVELEDAAQWF